MINRQKELYSQLIVYTSQVFISYDRKSNGELQVSYGFVPRQGTNPRDSVELPLSLKKLDKCYQEKVEALKKNGLSISQCFPLQVTGWPLELMAYAYLAVCPPSMSGNFEEMAATASILLHPPPNLSKN